MKRAEWWPLLAARIRGHYNYYAIGGNFRSIRNYYERVRQLTWKWLNQRSQQRSYNWEQYQRLLHYNPLPKPRIYHGYPVLQRMHA
jgi:hypothetical protein